MGILMMDSMGWPYDSFDCLLLLSGKALVQWCSLEEIKLLEIKFRPLMVSFLALLSKDSIMLVILFFSNSSFVLAPDKRSSRGPSERKVHLLSAPKLNLKFRIRRTKWEMNLVNIKSLVIVNSKSFVTELIFKRCVFILELV